MFCAAAPLPQSVPFVLPRSFQVADQLTFGCQYTWCGFDAGAGHQIQRIEQFTDYIDLFLPRGIVAHSDRTCAVEPWQPGHGLLIHTSIAIDAVQDPHLVRAGSNGTQHPVAPLDGFLMKTGVQQRRERERCIPQPAIAIIPIEAGSGAFRQGGGQCGHHRAGRAIDQRFEG